MYIPLECKHKTWKRNIGNNVKGYISVIESLSVKPFGMMNHLSLYVQSLEYCESRSYIAILRASCMIGVKFDSGRKFFKLSSELLKGLFKHYFDQKRLVLYVFYIH